MEAKDFGMTDDLPNQLEVVDGVLREIDGDGTTPTFDNIEGHVCLILREDLEALISKHKTVTEIARVLLEASKMVSEDDHRT